MDPFSVQSAFERLNSAGVDDQNVFSLNKKPALWWKHSLVYNLGLYSDDSVTKTETKTQLEITELAGTNKLCFSCYEDMAEFSDLLTKLEEERAVLAERTSLYSEQLSTDTSLTGLLDKAGEKAKAAKSAVTSKTKKLLSFVDEDHPSKTVALELTRLILSKVSGERYLKLKFDLGKKSCIVFMRRVGKFLSENVETHKKWKFLSRNVTFHSSASDDVLVKAVQDLLEVYDVKAESEELPKTLDPVLNYIMIHVFVNVKVETLETFLVLYNSAFA